MDQTHRIGRHSCSCKRPILVKFVSYKTRQAVLLKRHNFKGKNFSVAGDFSPAVKNVSKHLVVFTKDKSAPYPLRLKTLFMGPKRHIYDETSKQPKKHSNYKAKQK